MDRRPFRPTLHPLESRIALSGSSFFSSLFGNLFGSSSTSTSKSKGHAPVHNLAYYQKLAPTNARAAQIVMNVEMRQEHQAELKAERLAAHPHAHA